VATLAGCSLLQPQCTAIRSNERQRCGKELHDSDAPVTMKNCTLRSSRGCRDSGSGYTLLELLVVIAILGIVAGGVSISVAPSEHRRMMHEVDRLAALFRVAHEQTRVSGRPISWIARIDGYQFEVDGEVHGSDEAGDPLRPRAWPFPVQHVDAPTIVFGREPLLNPVQISIAGAEKVFVL
jgi:type II secretion system protein H